MVWPVSKCWEEVELQAEYEVEGDVNEEGTIIVAAFSKEENKQRLSASQEIQRLTLSEPRTCDHVHGKE